MGIDNFYEEMNDRISQIKKGESNCYGSAFYLALESDKDVSMNRRTIIKEYSKLERELQPKKGFVVDWRKDNIPFHAGIIVEENPYMVLHRNSQNGRMYKSKLNDLNEVLKKTAGVKPVYRIPSSLGN